MAGVSKVSGSGGPIDPNSGRVNPTPKRNFGDLMKVDKSDPEQKKKKKQKAEQEEEKKTDSILAQGQKIHKPTPGQLDKFEKKAQTVEAVGDSEKRQPKQRKRTEEEILAEGSSAPSPVKSTTPFEPSSKDIKTDSSDVLKKTKPPEEIPPEEPLYEDDLQFEQKMADVTASKKPESKIKEPTPPLLPPSPTPVYAPNLLSPASNVAPAYASLTPEVFTLFERLIGSMSVMNTSGITETTIELNSSEFSTFAGAKIVITEHSTAPKAFNIEFLGTTQTVDLFAGSVANLMAAFKNGNYAFTVNRIDTSLLKTQRPLFHRKDNPGDKGEKGEDQLK